MSKKEEIMLKKALLLLACAAAAACVISASESSQNDSLACGRCRGGGVIIACGDCKSLLCCNCGKHKTKAVMLAGCPAKSKGKDKMQARCSCGDDRLACDCAGWTDGPESC